MEFKDSLLEILQTHKEEKFRIFSQKLISQPEILGVRTPMLKKIAKDFSLKLDVEEIRLFKPILHEEFVIKAFLIINIKDDESKFALASEFVKTMPNWAICDQFDAIKFKDSRFVNLLLSQCLSSNLEYEKRFFYVYYMRNLAAFELNKFFEICINEKDERYYVKMAMAWALAEIFIKFKEPVLNLLESKRLDKFVQNKTISKIRDSFRVQKSVKDELVKLRI
ncbi:DNA alkylation repair protein [Campylobacter sp. MOP51]|uniref:DNA alkylation repair protein n=1 Tax=Campylobacter canis TaxID=3378588 RepID=UPI003C359B1F